MGQAVSLIQTSTRYAGTGTATFNGDFGSATTLALNAPSYVILDSAGNEYISDTGNNCVREINAAGSVTTLAGLVVTSQGDTCSTTTNPTPTTAQGLLRPTGIALDTNGNLYIADAGHNCIRRLTSGTTGTANLTTVAGTCSTTAALSSTPNPSGLVIDASNNLYIALQDNSEATMALDVNQVARQSVITTNSVATNKATECVVAGTISAMNPVPCTGVTNGVTLSGPSGLALDFNGNVYVADTGNNCVREVIGNTAVTTLVGVCTNDGTKAAAATTLTAPFGLAFSQTNTLFISESGANSNVYAFTENTGKLALKAGSPSGTAGAYNSTRDGLSAENVLLNQPRGIAFDANNNYYLVDSSNNILRFMNVGYVFPPTPVGTSSSTQLLTYIINTNANLSVAAGSDYSISSTTCTGAFTAAAAGAAPTTCQVFVQFTPTRPGLRYSPLTITDSVSKTSVETPLQGTGTGPLGLFEPGIVNTVASNLIKPVAIDTDSAGNAYVLEQGTTPGTADLRLITAAGNSSTYAIPPGTGLVSPNSVVTDAAGNWYFTDATLGTVARYGSDGSINSSYVTGLTAPAAAYVDGFGNLFIAQQGTAHNVIEAYAAGGQRVIAGDGTDPSPSNVPSTNALFTSPSGLYIDVNGILYISDSGAHKVFAVDTLGRIHVVAGNGTTVTTNASSALGTAMVNPTSVTADAAENVYIADSSANIVYIVYAASNSGSNIATVIGNGTAGATGDGGFAKNALVSGPLSLALDGSGDLFVVDSGNKSVREITYPNPTLNFGAVAVGTTSPVMTQSFLNVGTTNLNLLSAIGTTDARFAVNTATTTCGVSILSGQFCTIGYTYTPTTTGGVTAESILASNAYNSPQPITLKANFLLNLPITNASSNETEVYGNPFPETSTFNVGTNPPVTGTLTYTVTVNGVTKTLCTTAAGTLSPSSTCNAPNSGLNVGSYTVLVTYSGDGNYAGTTYNVTLVVTPAPLTVTTNNQSRPYGTPNPTLTGSVAGAVNGDSFTVAFSTTATITSPVGTYPITATLTPGATTLLSNYTVSNPGGTLTVTANTTTVPVVSCPVPSSKTYGTPNPTFVSVVTGALNGDTFTLTYSTTATTTSPVGSYPVTITVSGAAAANYATITVPTTCALNVTPAPTSTSLMTSGTPSTVGTSVTFTATVVSTTAGSTIEPSGIVSFYDGSALIGTGMLTVGATSSIATFTTSGLQLGSHTITAVYPASTNFLGSSGMLTQIVSLPAGSFTLTATPAFQLVRGAATTTYNITVTSVGGFVGPVALTCAGAPTDGTCSFAPATVQVTTAAAGTSVMSVTNTAADAALTLPARPGSFAKSATVMAGISWPYAFTVLGLLFAALGMRKRGRARGLILLLLLGVTIAGAVGCGCPPIANRNYTITVTGTSVNGGAAPQSAQVSLAVGTAQ